MSFNPFIALTSSTTSVLVPGPLKHLGVMGTLLGRRIPLIDRKTVYLGGYELVTVDHGELSDTHRPAEYALNPTDYGVVTLTQYDNLTPEELSRINEFNGVGTITRAHLNPTTPTGDPTMHLVHYLLEGIPFTRFDFGPNSNRDHSQIYDEAELNIISPVLYLKRAKLIRESREARLMPLQSRK